MEYFLDEQQVTVRDLARRIAEERILPLRAELDEKEEFPWEIIKELADADMFRVFIPEEYEGLGGRCLDLCLVIEELSRACGGIAISYAANALGCLPLIHHGSEEQKKKYLPQVASGSRLTAFALTESTAGSDAGNIKTSATRRDGGYVLNGTKQFITNGGEAEIYTVIAMTDPSKGSRGASALVVEKDTPGFSFGKKEQKVGIRASSTRELVFRNCTVPEENLIGREGSGFIITVRTIDRSRPGVAAQAVGIAQGALEAAVDYARKRVQFGHPISAQQAVQHMLANMATDLEAARALVYAVARNIDSGAKDFAEAAAMAKVFASDMAMRVTLDAVQIFGGAGYMKDYPVEKMMRDAKITQIYEGTNQVLRNAIALDVLKRRAMRE
ncbi:MAG: acyl-CoA dehydrogenase [Chloroflexi bacterium]|nr:MAG: acyl-CoA dehydrogenase [Chloroflexota bacterium]RLC94979.1 MAG: acyl-CoA dehydrogenase [Chloroflexota bacterium]